MRTVNLTTIGGLDYNAAIFGAGDGINAAVLFQLYAALCQNLFQYICSIGVIVRQNTITGSHHGDLHAQLSEGGNNFRTGDARTSNDDIFRQLSSLIDLLPSQDTITISPCPRQPAWRRPRGNPHQV